jgi:hypothetical protein
MESRSWVQRPRIYRCTRYQRGLRRLHESVVRVAFFYHGKRIRSSDANLSITHVYAHLAALLLRSSYTSLGAYLVSKPVDLVSEREKVIDNPMLEEFTQEDASSIVGHFAHTIQ